ncbi:U3 small nucleolar RNA-associated protein 4 homolog [Microcaecilia unicolor]|uniref:U3 small nucleolar RNA-associated protein 4 homolog n=1 Tax=Microcaecilia unicolor TaxID=1415580 RepID=A0A6P7Y6A2_9AMPH|nr:U3 small nucleolar RNA-associated protein 4 homolog [Microcaecilia unicolor]
MGEFQVHRVRFFHLLPSGIRCMDYSGLSDRLALARLDGSVELYNLAANCFQEKVFPGNESRSTEAICWAAECRLFTAGLSGDILEYDLHNLCIKYSLNGFGGPIWSMAANRSGTHLAIGCEDGSVKLFQVLPEKIQYETSLDRQKGRILSLAWHPAASHIVTGSIDMIRVLDVKTGHAVRRIAVDRSKMGMQNRECVVWGVAFLSSGTLVSADSAGKVQFWDSEKGTLIQTHQVTNVDVLALSVSQNEDSLVVGTSEGTVFQFQLVPVRTGETARRWVRTKPFRHHTHDVRTVVHGPSTIISGGLDSQLVIRPLMEKVESKTYDAALRKFVFPHRRLVSCAQKAKLLLFQFPQYLELWRLGKTEAVGKHDEVLPISRSQEHLLQLKKKGPEHICCSAISPCGSWISYATPSRLYVHRLQYENGVSISKMPRLLYSAHQILFSADSTKLFVASDRVSVHMFKLSETGCKHVHTFQAKSGSAEATCLLAASADGNWLAAASLDLEINVYSVKLLKHHCTLPVYKCPVTALAIQPMSNNLIIAYSDQQLFEFSIQEKQYSTWCRKVQQHGLHRDWRERDTPITNITFNPSQPAHILLHDTYSLCIIDKTLPLPDDKTPLLNQAALRNLSEGARKAHSHAFKISKKFQPLLFMELLDEGTLVVVERPLTDIQAQLPPPVRQKKFGT